ncbi:sugar transferase [Candidatus Parcubacteria bacterium]|nr:MAG: sugar transferase [Candidatus Parcubacteria bacterium]
MKKADFISNIALVPLDFILLMTAAFSAYYLRFSEIVSGFRPVFYEMPVSDFFQLVVRVSFFAVLIFALSGFYTMHDKKLARELPKIITGVSTVVIFLILSIFWQRELFSSRFIIILSWALAIVYLFLARILVILVRNLFFKKGYGLAKIIILGEKSTREPLVEVYAKKAILGFKVVAEFETLEELLNTPEILQEIKNKKIDILFQTDSNISKDKALDILTYCQENHMVLRYAANLFQAQNINIDLNSIAGLPIVEIQGTPLDGWRRVAKRTFDFVIALFLIILLLPLFITLAIIIRATSAGPAFVKLKRVGKKGRAFDMYKFRSMIKDAQAMKTEIMNLNERNDGPLFKVKNDPRITKIGKWLRRTSLDELPQLFNVLKGEMSLVGPRPHEPEEVSHYERGYKKLLTIKPGMTGMAQVSGRSNLLFTEEAKLDIFYIENWSMFLDLIILLKTPKAMLKGEQS